MIIRTASATLQSRFLPEATYVVNMHDHGRIDVLSDIGEPYSTPATYIDREGTDYALLKDYSENEGMLKAFIDAGLVEDTGEIVPTGYTHFNRVRIIKDNWTEIKNES